MPEQHKKKLHHYNTPGQAHELTFSCYRKRNYLYNQNACEIMLEEFENARRIYLFRLWAYVLMANHVHILLWPLESEYDIAKILSGIKRTMSKRYGALLKEKDTVAYDKFLLKKGNETVFTFWQPGGGFDRNLWNSKAIHDSIAYIEANPVRKGLVLSPEEWKWSSAYARCTKSGVVPDIFNMPVAMPNPQVQRLGIV
jgi:putative transposase